MKGLTFRSAIMALCLILFLTLSAKAASDSLYKKEVYRDLLPRLAELEKRAKIVAGADNEDGYRLTVAQSVTDIKHAMAQGKSRNEVESLIFAAIWFENAYDIDFITNQKEGVRHSRLEEVIGNYSKAIAINDKYTEAYFNRGFIYLLLGRSQDAISDYTRCIKLNPKIAFAYNNRGNAFINLKEKEKAVVDYSQAIKINPHIALFYNNRGYAYALLLQTEKAIQDFNQAIKLEPKNADTYYNRSGVYFVIQQYDKALADCNRAIKLDPTQDVYFNLRGQVKEGLGAKESAKKDFETAEKLKTEGQ